MRDSLQVGLYPVMMQPCGLCLQAMTHSGLPDSFEQLLNDMPAVKALNAGH